MASKLQSSINSIYSKREKELRHIVERYSANFEDEYERKKEALESGAITKQEYNTWVHIQLKTRKDIQEALNKMTEKIVDASTEAAMIINEDMPVIFAEAQNHEQFKVETATGVSFDLYNEDTVRRLQQNNPRLLPTIDPPRDLLYKRNQKRLSNEMQAAIMRGDSIPEIAKRLGDVVGFEERASIRNARTMMTCAQNGGTMEGMLRAEKMGIEVEKEWLATTDSRTRDSHAHMNGERRPVKKKFSNGLMYPGDSTGPGAEVYNCRCTLLSVLPDFDTTPGNYYAWRRRKKEEEQTKSNLDKKYESLRQKMDEKGIPNVGLQRTEDARAFADALDEAIKSNKHGGFVDRKTTRELGHATMLLAKDETAGVIVKHGDIEAVFKNPINKTRGAVDDLIISARHYGGEKMDCFGIGLVNKYEQCGFVPVARVPFNAEYVSDPVLLKQQPEVYVLMKNGDSTEKVIEKNSKVLYNISNKADLNRLPIFEGATGYEDALKYRDKLLEKVKK